MVARRHEQSTTGSGRRDVSTASHDLRVRTIRAASENDHTTDPSYGPVVAVSGTLVVVEVVVVAVVVGALVGDESVGRGCVLGDAGKVERVEPRNTSREEDRAQHEEHDLEPVAARPRAEIVQ